MTARTATIIHLHNVGEIQTYWEVGDEGHEWTNLVVGDVRVTIHGPHTATVALLMDAARQCPVCPVITETYEQLRERTLREDVVRGVGA